MEGIQRLNKLTPLLISILMSIGCEKRLTEGHIAEKQYEPSRTWTQMQTVGEITTPVIHHDDEDFIFIMEGFNADNELVKQTFYVSEGMYNDHEVGEFIYFFSDTMKWEDSE